MERRERRKAVDAFEDAEKRKVRLRDGFCRWPACDYCRRFAPQTEVAHLKAKGRGGDHGVRSTAAQMILLCRLRHQGPISLHSGDCRISPLTSRGTDGPCIFEMQTEAGWKVISVEDER